MSAKRSMYASGGRTVRAQPGESRYADLLDAAIGPLALEVDLEPTEIRRILYRVIEAGRSQGRRAPAARIELARTLGPSLQDLDPVPRATIDQARRLATLRRTLLEQGALPTAVIANARGMTPSHARTWISRLRKAHRIFTVIHEGETLVPAFLLDDALEPRDVARQAIEALRAAGEDGWALWAWFGTPSAWLGGAVPSVVLQTDPERVTKAARRRAAAAA